MKKIIAYPEYKNWRIPQIFGDEKFWLNLNEKVSHDNRKVDNDRSDRKNQLKPIASLGAFNGTSKNQMHTEVSETINDLSSKQSDPKNAQKPKNPESKIENFDHMNLKAYMQPIVEDYSYNLISAMAFDKSGEFVAIGDRAGRVIIFNRNPNLKTHYKYSHYVYMTEFQSHINQFDKIRAIDVKEKIKIIEWLPNEGDNLLLLTSNGRTPKLWKVNYKQTRLPIKRKAVVSKTGTFAGIDDKIFDQPNNEAQMFWPSFTLVKEGFHANLQSSFDNLHEFDINSLSLSSNGENFITSDDLVINLWNLEVSQTAFNVLNIEPKDWEKDLTETITMAKFCPEIDLQFIYGTSSGNLHLVDLRLQSKVRSTLALRDLSSVLEMRKSDLDHPINDVCFSSETNRIISRDLCNVKIWDLRQSKSPELKFELYPPNLVDYIYANLYYDKEDIFDRFTISSDSDGQIVTGLFDNEYEIFNVREGTRQNFHLRPSPALKNQAKGKGNNNFTSDESKHVKNRANREIDDEPMSNRTDFNSIDFSDQKKIKNCQWHPTEKFLALTSANLLIMQFNHTEVKEEPKLKDLSKIGN